MTRTITALFDSMNDADRACDQLSQIGVGRDRVEVHMASPEEMKSFDGGERASGASDGPSQKPGGGLLGSLKNLFLPDEDRGTYEEGLRRGHALLSVQVDESRADEVVQLLEKNTEALDVEAKGDEWRQGGWSGPVSSTDSLVYDTPASSGRASAGSYQTSGMDRDRDADFVADDSRPTGVQADPAMERGRDASAMSGARQTLQAGQEERIPIVEERLAVGKREVERGGARVRSYVVERPVHEQVSLREEHVSIERRPVDQPLSAADDVFRDREIEVRETAEEAVVAKEARVVEEVVIRKDQDVRTDTIDDTVRRTEVDVEDGRGPGEPRSFQGGATERFADTDADRDLSDRPAVDPNLTNRP